MFLEEAGLPYEIKPVNINTGDQFKPEYLKISPSNKMPAIIDHAPADGGVRRSRSSNPVPSCCISPRKPAAFSLPTRVPVSP